MSKKQNRIINIIALIGAGFLALCYILYLLGGTAFSDSGGLLVSITALAAAILPPALFPFLKRFYNCRWFLTIKILYSAALVIFMVVFLIFSIVILSSYDRDFQLEDGEDIIIVCGCYTDGYTPSKKLQSRIDTAYKLLAANPSAICIASGGMGEDERISEAESIYKNLVDMGISPNRIIKEDYSRDTYQNVIFSIEKMKEYNIDLDERVVFVSSDFHSQRVVMIAREQGLDARAAPAPSENSIALCSSLVREFMSYIRYFLLG